MTNRRWRKSNRQSNEAGQAIVFVLLALGLFLLAAVALAVDLSNLWFHRQAAQSAADAACTAGAMDLLVEAQGGATGHQGFTTGTAFTCSAGSTAVPCQYAAFNGYDSANTSPGNVVDVSFPGPGAVPGVALLPPGLAGTQFIRVDVLDHVSTYFSGLLSGKTTQDVRAFAACGVVLAKAPIPILVLDPHNPVTTPASTALDIQGNPVINIVGGPNKSIQVNSDATLAVNIGGSATIDLTKGGPGFNGSDLGAYGGPTTAPTGFVTAGSGGWHSPASPISDPYAQIAAPPVPADVTGVNVAVGQFGCPDPLGCTHFVGGRYPSGICLGGGCPGSFKNTGIFDPGLYYLNGGLALKSNSLVRPSNAVGDGSGGTTFYLTGSPPTCSGQTGLVCVGSSSGSPPVGVTAFSTSLVQCPGGPAPDPALNLPATLTGNVLLAPCSGTYGDPLGKYRGILFFADRSSGAGGGWGGGGGFLLAGSMYFHHCNASGTGVNCGDNPTFYNSIFTLSGNSGSASFVLGNIITDNLHMNGNPTINMALNPNAAYSTLKASLLR